VPWYVRWAIILPFLLIIGFLVWWAYDAGMELAGFHSGEAEQQIEELRDRVKSLESENAKQANQIAVDDRQVQMQQAMANEVQEQVKALHDENERLKEDLSFFQNLPLAGGSDAELSIHNLKLVGSNIPGEYHCRMLLVQGVQRRGKEFQGDMKILVNGDQGGKKVVVQLPQNAAEVAGYRLNFKYYQSLERVFKIPAEIHIDSVEIRIFEKGMQEPKVKQTVQLS
jgi:hypothetical protein